MSTFTKYVIIVSGGNGSRMQSQFPKQFLDLNGRPILMHTINAFCNTSAGSIKIVLVLNESHRELWEDLCLKHHFERPYELVFGGESRFHSVQNGLKYIAEKESDLDKVLIAVHDGVRPLVDQRLIHAAYDCAAENGSAIPCIKSKDSVRIIDQEGKSRNINRESVIMVQTPQTFRGSLLYTSYQRLYDDSFTDDASVIEYSGYPIHLVEGDIRNIKITYSIDLKIAEVLISNHPS